MCSSGCSTATTTTRPCYLEQDHGLASLTEMDASCHRASNFVSRSMTMGYATSYNRIRNNKNYSALFSSPRSARFEDQHPHHHYHHPHFLAACFRCKNPLGDNRDIFMYRGDTPFCSEECRQEQIETDEAKEKNRSLSSSMKALRKKEQRNNNKSASPNKARDYSFRTGAVAAA